MSVAERAASGALAERSPLTGLSVRPRGCPRAGRQGCNESTS